MPTVCLHAIRLHAASLPTICSLPIVFPSTFCCLMPDYSLPAYRLMPGYWLPFYCQLIAAYCLLPSVYCLRTHCLLHDFCPLPDNCLHAYYILATVCRQLLVCCLLYGVCNLPIYSLLPAVWCRPTVSCPGIVFFSTICWLTVYCLLRG